MVSSFVGEQKSHAIAVFDIDSASVGVGIFLCESGGNKLIWSYRVSYSVQQELEYTRFVRSMLAALLDAGMKLSSEGVPHMHRTSGTHVRHMRCVCILSSPWFVGKVGYDTVHDEKGISVTQQLVKERLAAIEAQLIHSPSGEHFKSVMHGTQTLESSLVRVLLNGYQVSAWQGRKCTDLALSAWFSVTSPDVHTQIQDVAEKVLPNTTIEYRSSTQALFDVVRARLPQASRVSMIEVGGEVTTVTSVEEGVMQETTTFPLGTHGVIRTLMEKDEAEPHARGTLALLKKRSPADEELPEPLRRELEDWHTRVTDAILTAYNGVTPARNVVLVADRDLEDWYTRLLSEPTMQQGIREALGFRAVPLVPSTPADAPATPSDTRLSVLGLGLSTGPVPAH